MITKKPLTVTNLTKIYRSKSLFFNKKNFTAVNNISFTLSEGEILGFLGQNGAGKTTTIQMLLGILWPTCGTITYFGKNFSLHLVETLQKIGYASGYDKLPARLTIWENLDIYGRLYGLSSYERFTQIKSLLQFFDMYALKEKPAGELSAGQMTRVLLAKAFLQKPPIVLLDEPTASLDPEISQVVREFILTQRKQYGTSFLLTSHNMPEVTQVCDRIIMMRAGIIIADDTPETLAASIASTKINLVIKEGVEALIQYLEKEKISFQKEAHEIIINVKEDTIGPLLHAIAHQGILYSQISIDRPTLENYFLEKTKQTTGNLL